MPGKSISLSPSGLPLGNDAASGGGLQEHLNWVVETMPGFSYRCLLDEHWTMLIMTSRVETVTGYPASDFIDNCARTFESVIHPEDSARVASAVGAAVENDEQYLLEYRIVAKDGSVRRVLEKGKASRGENGLVAWLDGYIVDRTEYQALLDREQLRKDETEAQARALVELAVSRAVGDGRVEPASQLATSLVSRASGVARVSVWLLNEQRTELGLVDLYQRSDGSHQSSLVLSATDYPAYFEAMSSGRLVDATNAQTDPRTSEFTEGYLKPLGIGAMLDAALRVSGEVVGVLCLEHVGDARTWGSFEKTFAGEVADQISLCLLNHARNEAQERQEKLQEQLFRSQKLEAVGRLAGGIAHDFNNLLTIIDGFAEQLSEALEGETHKEDLNEIRTATARATELTGQLLTFSRKENVKLGALNATSSVGVLKRMLDRLINDKVQLHMDLPEEELFICADEGLVHQLLTNLIVNAQDAIESDGDVWVSLKEEMVQEELPAEGATIPAGSYVVLRVRDSGSGIAPQVLPNIFEPFFTTKPAGSGTGLGLATVYGIVHRCHGALRVDSTVGEGTTFDIYFPSLPETELRSQSRRPSVLEEVSGDGRRVLVAEDNAPVLELISRTLRRAGFEVVPAPSTSEALALIAQQSNAGALGFELILSDMAMPGGGGRRILEARNGEMAHVPIGFISGYMTDQEAILVEDYPRLQKPFSAKQLLPFVQTVFEPDVS